jgi:hypothetical protein
LRGPAVFFQALPLGVDWALWICVVAELTPYTSSSSSAPRS